MKKNNNLIEGENNDLDPVHTAEEEIKQSNLEKEKNRTWQPVENLSFMEYLPALDKYRCVEHPEKEFNTLGGAKKHVSSSYHNMTWDGKSENNDDQPNDENKGEVGENERKVMELLGESPIQDENSLIGEDAFEIHKAEKAKAIARVLENPYVNMFFVESRTLKLFPPTFDEGDIIREALDYYGRAIGFSINVGHDPRLIKDENLKKKILFSAKSWDEFESGDGDGS